ncbi:homoserine O-succinyltransferase [Bradyrhizobium sp. NP1]|uniref:homoserine O-succinyltransferase MetA n=1 Tax=Bradyrhizobium sp. NP1 TaxID=3049772 RepID=UPI0025A51653|nr:homoserine O-succinyltransferase [Bradyrhizobium sp. NP1]WJR78822.1 homoserine O-succinyltransferase [Bradyrhizobium sp. NP1]
MTLLFDKQKRIASPALVPGQEESARATELTIGLINNMPDSALKATERQFMRLLQAAAGGTAVRFRCFSLPSVRRSKAAQSHIDDDYCDIADLDRLPLDGLIVTGAEPNAATLPEEPFWRELTGIVDWAKTHTRSTIWSCLAAHAAVLHLDGIERHPLGAKCSGVYDCARVERDWLTSGLASPAKVSHSRFNGLRESELAARGYRVLTRSGEAGVDIFVKQWQSRFVFFQGHPEYDALSLQREYMRDVARFLAGERETYPAIPTCYFDDATEAVLAHFETRARKDRDPMLAAELPGLTLRADIGAGSTASVIFANWLDHLAQRTAVAMPAR